jgi:hypothetical protein
MFCSDPGEQGGKSMRRFKQFVFVVSATAVVVDTPAYAYLDGATISLFLQGVTGAAAAAILFGRTYLAKAANLFRRSAGTGSNDKPKG